MNPKPEIWGVINRYEWLFLLPYSVCKIPKLVEHKCHFLLKPCLLLLGKISCPPLFFAPIALCIKLYYSYYALITINCNLSVYVSISTRICNLKGKDQVVFIIVFPALSIVLTQQPLKICFSIFIIKEMHAHDKNSKQHRLV